MFANFDDCYNGPVLYLFLSNELHAVKFRANFHTIAVLRKPTIRYISRSFSTAVKTKRRNGYRKVSKEKCCYTFSTPFYPLEAQPTFIIGLRPIGGPPSLSRMMVRSVPQLLSLPPRAGTRARARLGRSTVSCPRPLRASQGRGFLWWLASSEREKRPAGDSRRIVRCASKYRSYRKIV